MKLLLGDCKESLAINHALDNKGMDYERNLFEPLDK